MQRRRETSTETAARFLAMRAGQVPAGPRGAALSARHVAPSAESLAAERLVRWMAQVNQLAAAAPPGRVVVDIGRRTLERIHEILIESMHADADHGRMIDHLTFVAEQMVARALGIDPCDDPPLTDRRPL